MKGTREAACYEASKTVIQSSSQRQWYITEKIQQNRVVWLTMDYGDALNRSKDLRFSRTAASIFEEKLVSVLFVLLHKRVWGIHAEKCIPMPLINFEGHPPRFFKLVSSADSMTENTVQPGAGGCTFKSWYESEYEPSEAAKAKRSQ